MPYRSGCGAEKQEEWGRGGSGRGRGERGELRNGKSEATLADAPVRVWRHSVGPAPCPSVKQPHSTHRGYHDSSLKAISPTPVFVCIESNPQARIERFVLTCISNTHRFVPSPSADACTCTAESPAPQVRHSSLTRNTSTYCYFGVLNEDTNDSSKRLIIRHSLKCYHY